MAAYAVLGATGNTGRALIQVLLQRPNTLINAYCRSRSKFLRLCHDFENIEQVQVYPGSLDDVSQLADCMRGTRAVFLAVAVIDNMPGCTIAQDTAKAVVAALELLKMESNSSVKLPKLVVLSSASLEDSFCGDVPAVVHAVLNTAVSYLYKDLALAEKYLRAQSNWISTTFIKPGGLVNGRQSGHAISMETAKTPLSFLDLAAGMVEVAESDVGQYDLRNVSIIPMGEGVPFPWNGLYFVCTGLLFHFLPWTYNYIGEYSSIRPSK